jgi:hypothetical protein
LLTGAEKVIQVGMNGKPIPAVGADPPRRKSVGRRRIPARDPGKEAVLEVCGGLKPLADALGISSAAVSKWKKIPRGRVVEIERLTGVPRYVQLPDLHPEEL